jgi:hypothetical protein
MEDVSASESSTHEPSLSHSRSESSTGPPTPFDEPDNALPEGLSEVLCPVLAVRTPKQITEDLLVDFDASKQFFNPVCKLCQTVISTPAFAATCEHVYCRPCLDTLFSGSVNLVRCPDCRKEAETDHPVNSASHQRYVNQLKVVCPGKDDGCTWMGVLSDYHRDHSLKCLVSEHFCLRCCHEYEGTGETHMQCCSERTVRCRHCHIHGTLSSMRLKHGIACGMRTTPCVACGEQVESANRAVHDNECRMGPYTCTTCNGVFRLHEVSSHHSQGPCRALVCDSCCAVFKEDQSVRLVYHRLRCPKVTRPCKNGCGEELCWPDQGSHTATVCPKKAVTCRYVWLGCTYVGTRDSQKQHEADAQEFHLRWAVNAIRMMAGIPPARNDFTDNEEKVLELAVDSIGTLRDKSSEDHYECTEDVFQPGWWLWKHGGSDNGNHSDRNLFKWQVVVYNLKTWQASASCPQKGIGRIVKIMRNRVLVQLFDKKETSISCRAWELVPADPEDNFVKQKLSSLAFESPEHWMHLPSTNVSRSANPFEQFMDLMADGVVAALQNPQGTTRRRSSSNSSYRTSRRPRTGTDADTPLQVITVPISRERGRGIRPAPTFSELLALLPDEVS